MIDYAPTLVANLKAVLPTYHELALTSKSKVPCVSWQERNNYVEASGDTLGYSNISYTIKVWANTMTDITRYAKEVDIVMRGLGFVRTSSGELYDRNSTMIQKIMTYEAIGLEDY